MLSVYNMGGQRNDRLVTVGVALTTAVLRVESDVESHAFMFGGGVGWAMP